MPTNTVVEHIEQLTMSVLRYETVSIHILTHTYARAL